MARSFTVISLLLQSTTHCRYRVYTKFLLTYSAIYRGNRKVLPLGITALQPQSHFHLGTPYIFVCLCSSNSSSSDEWILMKFLSLKLFLKLGHLKTDCIKCHYFGFKFLVCGV